MEKKQSSYGPILRLFRAKVKPGSTDKLLHNFATTSADVVQHEPGNQGFFFGQAIGGDENTVIFASVWKDIAAVKARFGDRWQESHLPAGYANLIEEHSVSHIDVANSWHVNIHNESK